MECNLSLIFIFSSGKPLFFPKKNDFFQTVGKINGLDLKKTDFMANYPDIYRFE